MVAPAQLTLHEPPVQSTLQLSLLSHFTKQSLELVQLTWQFALSLQSGAQSAEPVQLIVQSALLPQRGTQSGAPSQSMLHVAESQLKVHLVVAGKQSKLHSHPGEQVSLQFAALHVSLQQPPPQVPQPMSQFRLASGLGTASGALGSASGKGRASGASGSASGTSGAAETQRPITHVREASQSAWVSQLNAPERESTELQPSTNVATTATNTHPISPKRGTARSYSIHYPKHRYSDDDCITGTCNEGQGYFGLPSLREKCGGDRFRQSRAAVQYS